MAELTGRVAIVTGGAWGIGRAMSLAFAGAGARVVVADVKEERGERTAAAVREAGGEAIFARCDVSSEDKVAALVARTVETFGGVDALVNNAGIPGSNHP